MLTLSGVVNRILPRSSIGDLYPPYFFFSILRGMATSIELSLNPPTFNGNGSTRVGCDPQVEPQPERNRIRKKANLTYRLSIHPHNISNVSTNFFQESSLVIDLNP